MVIEIFVMLDIFTLQCKLLSIQIKNFNRWQLFVEYLLQKLIQTFI